MDLSGIAYEFHSVDKFNGDHKKPNYLSVCPIGEVPCMTESRFILMGELQIFLAYLSSKPGFQKMHPKEYSAVTEQYLNWFAGVLRPAAARLI